MSASRSSHDEPANGSSPDGVVVADDAEAANGEPAAREEYVQSLERGMRVLLAFSADAPTPTLSDVARTTGLNRATARRLLLTFVHLGFVRHDGRRFSLTPRMLDLGYAYLSSQTMVDVANPIMRRLTDEIHETSSLCVLDGGDVVFVARSTANRLMVLSPTVGYRAPAHLTSMGRVILALMEPAEQEGWLDRYTTDGAGTRERPNRAEFEQRLRAIAADGWVLVDGELEAGLRTIAAPIFDASGRCVAAMNVATHSERVSRDELRDELLPKLLEATAAISRALGARS